MRDRLVRISAFTRRELISTIRQPRLIITLVLGPFLILFVFGLGYNPDFPPLTTLIVGPEDSELTQQVDDYILGADLAGIDYLGTRTDRDGAIADLKLGEIDLVVILPPEVESMDTQLDQRMEIEVQPRAPDPVTTAQIEVASQAAISQINDEVVAQAIANVQEEGQDSVDDLEAVRTQLSALRDSFTDEELAQLQQDAGPAADDLEELSSQVSTGALALTGSGIDDPAEVAQDLDTAATALRALADSGLLTNLDDLQGSLDDADQALALLGGTSPDVLARPFDVQVYRQTPVEITLDRFYAPGLLALMLQHVAITFVALGMVRERRQGTSELLRVTPVGTTERLIGTSTAHLLLGLGVATALIGLIVAAFAVPAPISWLAFVGLVVLTLLASLGYGFLVAAAARSDSQAVQFSMLLLLTAVFFSGLFLPLERISAPVIWVSWALPTTHAFQGLQELMLLGLPVSDSVWLWLAGMAVLLLGMARLLVPWRDRSG
jgi:ABC-2 type transport system permease protein